MRYAETKKYYDRADVAEDYGLNTSLWKVEEAILSSLQNEIRNRPLLDIGIGAGRTTPHLRAVSNDYIGIDYSLSMINLCRRRHSDAVLLVADAREMTFFTDEKFTAVFWCYNGMDEVDGDDRLVALREISRILKPGGVFVFSSHNLDWKLAFRLSLRRIGSAADPIALLTESAKRFRVYSANLVARSTKILTGRGHAILLEYEDETGMILPTYYIGKEDQIQQLSRAGFTNVRSYGRDGCQFDESKSTVDPWIYYVARKATN